MRQFGLVGKSLSHSFSKAYFEEKFTREHIADAEYKLFELPDIRQIKDFIWHHPDLTGFNVTIPYKQSIIPFLDELSDEASEVNAVNTVVIQRFINAIYIKGFNTDIHGFRYSLQGLALPGKALVLGTGGAASSVRQVLQKDGCQVTLVSRDPQRGLPYSQLSPEIIADNKLIVNCTPLGTFPNINEKPDIPYEGLSGEHFLYDLVYNPSETAFLKEGIRRGAKTQNGLSMLYAQAESAWRLWSETQNFTSLKHLNL